jgi:hypothetical protein
MQFCPVEQCSAEAKSLKLRANGLSDCHPSGRQPRQPDGGARRTTLTITYLKKQAMGKKQMAKETLRLREKRKDAYSMRRKDPLLLRLADARTDPPSYWINAPPPGPSAPPPPGLSTQHKTGSRRKYSKVYGRVRGVGAAEGMRDCAPPPASTPNPA